MSATECDCIREANDAGTHDPGCPMGPRCSSCGQSIDPDTCGCGGEREGHGFYDGHPFIPMGCDCFRVS